MRVSLTISYDGSKFHGYQRQNSGVRTVANKLEKILKSLKIDSTIHASGRTDHGVHATNQVVHFDIPEFWSDIEKLKYMINKKAYPDIFCKKIKIVDNSFHARFSAKRRVYRYIITTKISVFSTPYTLFVEDIDEQKIKKGIKVFEGEHDFSYFKKSGGSHKNTVREIYKTRFYRYKDYYILYFEANGYLRSQIRMMVYFLLKINSSKLSIDELKEQLELKKRYTSGVVAPNGLYLSRIKY
jgi:tRNA pseudouridine38-40 synthase